MIYREDGWLAEVEVISQVPKSEPAANGVTEGVETTLKVIKTLANNGLIKDECLIKDGEIFTVWVADKYKHYAGWSLSNY